MRKLSIFLTRLLRQKSLPLILSLVLSLPAFTFLFRPGYYNMHDDMQIIRQLEMEKCFKDGQIPCRWTPDLGYGYGYPLFNYYPPLPYIFGQAFRFIGLSFIDTVRYTAILQFILSTVFMYLLSSALFGPVSGILAAVFYTYSPYHAVNVYIRGAMNEAWASSFFPLIFYFVFRYLKNRQPKFLFGLSVSLACLLLSHNPMVVVFSPFVFLWAIFHLLTSHRISSLPQFKKLVRPVLALTLTVLFSVCLSAFFTIPSIVESKLVQLDSMFKNYYHFSVHFVSLFQLFISRYWNDGPSVWGPYDGMPFQVGFVHWLVPFFIAVLLVFTLIRKPKLRTPLHYAFFLVAASGLVSIFMTHNRSTFIWNLIPLIQKIQFPWRFLNLSAFFLSLSVAWLPPLLARLKFKPAGLLIGLLTFLVIILNYRYFKPLHYGPVTDEQKLSGESWQKLVTSGIYDYLPKTSGQAPYQPASYYVDFVEPASNYSVLSAKKGTDWQLINLFLSQNSKVVFSTLYFPKLAVFDNNLPVTPSYEPELGRLSLSLTSGHHQIYLHYQNTPIRNLSNYVSLIAWLTSLIYLFSILWTNRRSRK